MSMFRFRKNPKVSAEPVIRSRDTLNKISASLTQLDKDLKIIDIAQEMGELEVTGSFQLPVRFSPSLPTKEK